MAAGAYSHFLGIPTRWDDNDVYGHVNNVHYYAFFDTVINTYLIRAGGLDILAGDAIGLCVESHCAFHASLAFPEVVRAGLRVGGRACTVDLAEGQRADLGGELVPATYRTTTALCAELGVALSEPVTYEREASAPGETALERYLEPRRVVVDGELLDGARFAAVHDEIAAALRTAPPAGPSTRRG